MLTHLLVRNLAVVDEIEIELDEGLTALTGETGAGKSILVDALGLALGQRAETDAVRPGARRAEVSATFELEPGSAAAEWLDANDLGDAGEDGDEDALVCVVRRAVTREGRSRGYVNGNAVPMQTLKELGTLLVDICGQQAHLSLARPDQQRAVLDQQGDYAWLLDEVRGAHAHWRALQAELEALASGQADQQARLDLLRFQVEELQAAAVRPGENEALERELKRAANLSRLREGANAALGAIYEGEADSDASAHDQVARAAQRLEELVALDTALEAPLQLLTEAQIQLSEAADGLRDYLADEPDSGAELADIEARLAVLHDLARKHRVTADELPALADRLAAELDGIENSDVRLERLQKETGAAAEALDELCERLGNARRLAAAELEAAVTRNLRELGMPDGSFTVHFTALPAPGPFGREKIEFRVALNPGLPPGPLAKVASGGELSRVSLAIQVASGARARPHTLIFDEVDAGVGGGTAEIVGALLRELSAGSQILCITHLPQVASKAHAQLRVAKLSDGESTRTRVTPLNDKERVEEVARMLGGVSITARTRAHAREMLAAADKDVRRAN